MTPLIRGWVKYFSATGADPTELMWFDISGAFHRADIQPLSLTVTTSRPPFNKCIFVSEARQHTLMVVVVGDDPTHGIVIDAWLGKDGNRPGKLPTLTYAVKDGDVHAGNLDGEVISETDKQMILRLVALWYGSLALGGNGYKPVVKQSFTNQRKIREGKPPIFDWVTVQIEPKQPKAQHQGGTHASPRLHDRRGHMRRLPSGKMVWVKACKVGDATRGIVFHDYEVRA